MKIKNQLQELENNSKYLKDKETALKASIKREKEKTKEIEELKTNLIENQNKTDELRRELDRWKSVPGSKFSCYL
jgi:predicted RNase H-like nuclease (RuvC/YqgF family)